MSDSDTTSDFLINQYNATGDYRFEDAAKLVDEQAAKIEALEKDAKRYQWLRSNDDWDCSPKPIVRLYSGPDFEPAQGWELDSIIDAAIAGEQA